MVEIDPPPPPEKQVLRLQRGGRYNILLCTGRNLTTFCHLINTPFVYRVRNCPPPPPTPFIVLRQVPLRSLTTMKPLNGSRLFDFIAIFVPDLGSRGNAGIETLWRFDLSFNQDRLQGTVLIVIWSLTDPWNLTINICQRFPVNEWPPRARLHVVGMLRCMPWT